MEYRVNRHSCYLLKYHLVVVTKFRHPVIVGDLKDRLISITKRIFEDNWNCIVHEVNTDADHIHILFEAKPQTSLSQLANNYKTVTSRLIRKEFSDFLKPYYWKQYFWSDSYFIGTVSERTHEVVTEYIRNQGANPS